jgi:hypothetical protein
MDSFDQPIIWQNDRIKLRSLTPAQDRFFAAINNQYFCRDGLIRSAALNVGSNGIFTDHDSAHYKSIDDFFKCHPNLRPEDKKEWLLEGAL